MIHADPGRAQNASPRPFPMSLHCCCCRPSMDQSVAGSRDDVGFQPNPEPGALKCRRFVSRQGRGSERRELRFVATLSGRRHSSCLFLDSLIKIEFPDRTLAPSELWLLLENRRVDIDRSPVKSKPSRSAAACLLFLDDFPSFPKKFAKNLSTTT